MAPRSDRMGPDFSFRSWQNWLKLSVEVCKPDQNSFWIRHDQLLNVQLQKGMISYKMFLHTLVSHSNFRTGLSKEHLELIIYPVKGLKKKECGEQKETKCDRRVSLVTASPCVSNEIQIMLKADIHICFFVFFLFVL